MRSYLIAVLVTAALSATLPPPVMAGEMGRACMKSDRKAKSRKLCACIDDVAEQNLSRKDRKLAVTFFKDPHKAQVIRQSDRRSHEQFWDRYVEFGAIVAASCGHLNN